MNKRSNFLPYQLFLTHVKSLAKKREALTIHLELETYQMFNADDRCILAKGGVNFL